MAELIETKVQLVVGNGQHLVSSPNKPVGNSTLLEKQFTHMTIMFCCLKPTFEKKLPVIATLSNNSCQSLS